MAYLEIRHELGQGEGIFGLPVLHRWYTGKIVVRSTTVRAQYTRRYARYIRTVQGSTDMARSQGEKYCPGLSCSP